MSEPAPKSREEEKAFIREALDVLQEFTTGETMSIPVTST